MRQFWLQAITLMLFLGGNVAAQQHLVEYNDKNDPCARFKMRILVPATNPDLRLKVKEKNGIDYQMIWNPCLQPEPLVAYAPSPPAPNQQGNFLGQRSFKFQFPTERSRQERQSVVPVPQSGSTFRFMWPQ